MSDEFSPIAISKETAYIYSIAAPNVYVWRNNIASIHAHGPMLTLCPGVKKPAVAKE